jgi:hypothetical protein
MGVVGVVGVAGVGGVVGVVGAGLEPEPVCSEVVNAVML